MLFSVFVVLRFLVVLVVGVLDGSTDVDHGEHDEDKGLNGTREESQHHDRQVPGPAASD